MKIKRLDHIGIRVMDVSIAITFYQKLRFTVARNDTKEHVVVLKNDSGVEIKLLDSGDNANNKNLSWTRSRWSFM